MLDLFTIYLFKSAHVKNDRLSAQAEMELIKVLIYDLSWWPRCSACAFATNSEAAVCWLAAAASAAPLAHARASATATATAADIIGSRGSSQSVHLPPTPCCKTNSDLKSDVRHPPPRQCRRSRPPKIPLLSGARASGCPRLQPGGGKAATASHRRKSWSAP